ncbi:MAG: hypothetical protein GX256_04605 [Fretibacterium sp.]|nr:hypothetical protein [Fretibacterium sp.]
MSKKIRPSLKDYLRTGVVRPEADSLSKEMDSNEAAAPPPSSDSQESFLSLLSPQDRETWQPILRAGVKVCSLPLDIVSAREDFRTADRNRYTFYILNKKGEPLRSPRTSVQIREPFELFLKWDETGVLELYAPRTDSPTPSQPEEARG